MAVTIVETPITGSPAYSPNIYTLTSTNSTELDFKYTARLFNGSTFLGEIKSVPHPVHGWGKFNVSSIVSSQLEEYIDFDATPVFSATSSVADIKVEFGEQYTSASTFIRSASQEENTKEYFNGSPFYEEFVDIKSKADSGEHPYIIASGDAFPNYPLTSRRNIQTAEGTKEWLYYYSDIWQTVAELEIRNDETQATSSIALPASLENDADAKVVAYRVDKTAIEASSSLSNLSKWSVRTRDPNGNASSRYISFELMECTYWDLYSLYFLNRFGGIDSFPFNGKVNKQVSAERNQYKSVSEDIDSAGNISYDLTKHTVKDYYVNYNNRYTLNSGWVNEAQQDAAIDLQTSPLVWLEKPNGIIVPVRIVSNTLQIQNRNDGVISVRMEVEHNEINNRQQV